MRVPFELRSRFPDEVDAVLNFSTALAGGMGSVWLIRQGDRIHAFERTDLLGDPKPRDLAANEPLMLHQSGYDHLLIVRTADGQQHELKVYSWDVDRIKTLMGASGVSGAAASSPVPPRPSPASSMPMPSVGSEQRIGPDQHLTSDPWAAPPALTPPPRGHDNPRYEPLPEPRHPSPRQPAQPQPQQFPPQVRDLTAEIRRAMQAPRQAARPSPRPPPSRSGAGARVLSLLALLAVGGGAAYFFLGKDGGESSSSALYCGDGVVTDYDAEAVIEAPVVTNPFGAAGYVCDDGGVGSNGTFDISANGSAPEHGICQAMGYDRALSVTWGDGPGAESSPMPHAQNWQCNGFVCGPSSNTYSDDNCSDSEMLDSITCMGRSDEQCDAGSRNADVPGAPCRTDCTLPRCGDGVVDADEQCDDGGRVAGGCSDACTLPVCGDGLRNLEAGEACDDGNAVAGDGCHACLRESSCKLLLLSDDQRSLTGMSQALQGTGHTFDALLNEPMITNQITVLNRYNMIVFYHTGHPLSANEQHALEAFVQAGGRLLMTGYDALGAPPDVRGAALLRVEVLGDGPWERNIRVGDSRHPALGSYAPGFMFMVNEQDHDQVEAQPELGSVAILEVGIMDKLTMADPVGRGVVYFWNGNREARDWSTPGAGRDIFLNLLELECW